jgi:hypothetical protein
MKSDGMQGVPTIGEVGDLGNGPGRGFTERLCGTDQPISLLVDSWQVLWS